MIFVSGCSRNLQFRQMCLPPVLILLADSHKSQWTPWLMPVWGVGNASQPCDRLTVGYPRVGQPVRKSSGYLWKKKKKKIIVHGKSQAFQSASICIWDKQLLKHETRGLSLENHNKHREAFVETSFIISTSTHRLVYLRKHTHGFPNGVISEISILKTTICHTKTLA